MAAVKRIFQVLLAEDNKADIELVREAIRERGIECVLQVVSDGERVVTLLTELAASPATAPLDLLILDMHLPRRDGVYILEHLRSTVNFAQVPVIMMTGDESSAVQEIAVRHAGITYFRKPANLDAFLALGTVVERILTIDKVQAAGFALK